MLPGRTLFTFSIGTVCMYGFRGLSIVSLLTFVMLSDACVATPDMLFTFPSRVEYF